MHLLEHGEHEHHGAEPSEGFSAAESQLFHHFLVRITQKA